MIIKETFSDASNSSFSLVISRLMQFLEVDEFQKVAEKLGMSGQAFYARKKTGSVPYDQIIKALQGSGISFEWLFYGLGEMRIVPRLKLCNEIEAPMGKIAIKYYPDISASAGFGCFNGDHCECDTIFVDRNLLPRATSKNIEAIRVHGDSMNPTMNEGDTIFVDKSQREIRNGKIFIIRMNEEVFVKRIFIAPKGLIVKSDNPDYPQFDIKKDEAEILGQVIYTMEYHG